MAGREQLFGEIEEENRGLNAIAEFRRFGVNGEQWFTRKYCLTWDTAKVSGDLGSRAASMKQQTHTTQAVDSPGQDDIVNLMLEISV